MKSLLLATLFVVLAPLAANAQTPTETRDQIRDRLLEQRENARDQIDDTRVQIAEEAATRRQEFRDRLETIQDDRQRLAIETVDEKIANLNKRYTTTLGTVLGKLENILNRMEARVAQLKAEGTDTSAVEAQLEAATLQIQNASAAIETQANKEYIVEITDEITLREAAQAVILELRSDLSEAKAAVTEAKNSVVTAARSLTQLN